MVSRGDFVAKGQVIGYAGQTGDVSTPQLHFEIRSGTTPVNPRSLSDFDDGEQLVELLAQFARQILNELPRHAA